MVYTIDQIKQITRPIAAAYGVKSMRLFGSYARGEATESSDVDILVDRGDIRSGFVLGGLYATACARSWTWSLPRARTPSSSPESRRTRC